MWLRMSVRLRVRMRVRVRLLGGRLGLIGLRLTRMLTRMTRMLTRMVARMLLCPRQTHRDARALGGDIAGPSVRVRRLRMRRLRMRLWSVPVERAGLNSYLVLEILYCLP